MAFGVAQGGSENALGYIVDVASGELLGDRLTDAQYAAVAWLADESGFFYNRFAGRPAGSPDFYNDRSLWLHRVNTLQSEDRKIMATGLDASVAMSPISSPEMQVGIGSDYVVLLIRDGYVRSFALYIARLESVLAGSAKWRKICSADEGVADFALSGETLFLVFNGDEPNGSLLALDASIGTLASAQTVVPAGSRVLDELNAGKDGVFITANDGGEQCLFFQPSFGGMRQVTLTYAGWVQSVGINVQSGDALVRITSWLQPGTIYAIDAVTGVASETDLQQRPAVNLEPFEYVRLLAIARDGVRVPISLLRRKGPVKSSPCLVRAYGAYPMIAAWDVPEVVSRARSMPSLTLTVVPSRSD